MTNDEDVDLRAAKAATDFTIVITPALMQAAAGREGEDGGDARLWFVTDCISNHRLADWRYTSDAIQAANRKAVESGVGPVRSVWPLPSDAGWPGRESRIDVITDGVDHEENDRPVVTARFSSETP
jgi:hypothetical protein